VRHLTLNPDATGRAFLIPADSFYDKVDLLAEVSAGGRQLRAGDDYLLDRLTIRCLRPPGGPLVARILGEPVSGYTERGAAEVRLVLRAWGPPGGTPDQQAAAADTALTRGIAALLFAVAGQDVVGLAADDEAGLEIRILKPCARICSVTRFLQRSDAEETPCAEARLTISGELELTLARGAAPEPEGKIERVELAASNGEPAR
jgi:hypothetical protein